MITIDKNPVEPIAINNVDTIQREQLSIAVKEMEGDVFEGLLKDVINNLLIDHKVYFVFSESKPQPASKIRSYKKMFYDELRNGLLKARDVISQESDIQSGKSILSSILSVTEDNLDQVIPGMLTRNFRFAFIVKKGTRSFNSSRASFLDNLVNRVIKNQRFDRSEIQKMIVSLARKNKHSLRISSAANGNEKLEIVVDAKNRKVLEGLNALGRKYRSLAYN